MPSTTTRHRASLGRAGTTTAYRKGCRCRACTSANTRAKQQQRDRKKQRGSRPVLTLVGDVPPDVQTEPQTDTTDPPAPSFDEGRAWGPAEKALRADIASLEETNDFGRAALIQGAIALTRQIDDYDFRGSKGPLVKTLVETIRAIRGKESGDGETLEELLAGLAEPLTGPAAGNAAGPE